MYCNHCKNIISDTMKFCPYCGSEIDGVKKEIEIDIHKQVSDWYKNEQFENIFSAALDGNNTAKCYFIRYISDAQITAQNEQLLENVIAMSNNGNPFSMSVLGIRKFCGGRKNILGYENEDLIKQGVELIKKAAEQGEASAMTFVAEWMIDGKYAEKNISSAYKLMKAASDEGYPSAMYRLGIWHKDGSNGISKKEELGQELIEKAAFFGDQNALKYFKENNNDWFESTLNYAIPEETLRKIQELISSDKSKYQAEKNELETEYESCQTKEDYIRLYKYLRDNSVNDNSLRDLFELLKVLVSNITGYSLDEVTLEEAEAATALAEKIVQLTDKYECPQHYLHFKEDLKTLKIDVDDESLPGLLDLVSNIFRKKHPKEIESYMKYATAKKDAKAVTGKGCVFVGMIIVAILSGIFLPIIGIIVGVLALFVKFGEIITINEFKKISPEIKNDYLLINALIGYGYTPVDPEIFQNKFDPEDVYENTVPSILNTKNP